MADTETRIPLPERTARRLADLLTAALAGQAVAQAATAAAHQMAHDYQNALAAVAEAHEAGDGANARFDRETGELVITKKQEEGEPLWKAIAGSMS